MKLSIDENLKHDIHKNKINKLFKNYGQDDDLLYKMAEKQAARITKGESAFWRSIAAEQMIGNSKYPDSKLKKIGQIFLFRSKQLGYKK